MSKKVSNDFGSVIRTIRLRKGLTMKEVADRMQIRETTIRKYEMNELTPKTSTKLALAKALGVSPSVLLADWSPTPSAAIGHLLSYFEAFGGSFLEKDGHIAIEFDALEPFIRSWSEEYNRLRAEHTQSYSSAKKTAAVDSYFDFLINMNDSAVSSPASSACSTVPSMQEAVRLTKENPPRLYSRKKGSDEKRS